jgi:hypothetical protein
MLAGWRAVVGKVIYYDKEDIKLTVNEEIQNFADSRPIGGVFISVVVS